MSQVSDGFGSISLMGDTQFRKPLLYPLSYEGAKAQLTCLRLDLVLQQEIRFRAP
jgi:hypothetical protein